MNRKTSASSKTAVAASSRPSATKNNPRANPTTANHRRADREQDNDSRRAEEREAQSQRSPGPRRRPIQIRSGTTKAAVRRPPPRPHRRRRPRPRSQVSLALPCTLLYSPPPCDSSPTTRCTCSWPSPCTPACSSPPIAPRDAGPGDRLQATSDGFLLYYLVQYLAVCIPGILGALAVHDPLGALLLMCTLIWTSVMRRPTLVGVDLPNRAGASSPPPHY